MLKIHRFNCAGLDVHKNLIIATIGITEYIQKDFKWIYDLLKSSFILPKDIRELSNLSRYRFKFICMSLKRYQNSMTVSNIALASVVSDLSVMNEVLPTKTIDENKITKLIHNKCKIETKSLNLLKFQKTLQINDLK